MQRGHLTLTDVLTVVAYGRRGHRAHADFYCLLARNLRNLPADKEKDLSRLVGTVVCVEGSRVSTVFKNRNAVSEDSEKDKTLHGERRDTPGPQFSGAGDHHCLRGLAGRAKSRVTERSCL